MLTLLYRERDGVKESMAAPDNGDVSKLDERVGGRVVFSRHLDRSVVWVFW